jgi:inner membrane protein
LPDLDVFYSFGDPVADFTYHRSVTHSVLVLALVSPVIAEALRGMFRAWHSRRAGWYALVYLVLLTHPLLDCFTTYGTQILWPVDKTPVSWSTVFIIDPAYTLPLLIGVLCALVMKKTNPKRQVVNLLALAFSTSYLAWTVYATHSADLRARDALQESGYADAAYKLVPGPFTSLLWRVIAVDDEEYHNLYFSLLDGEDADDTFASHPRNLNLLDGIEDAWAVRRLAWFSHGFYAVSLVGNGIAMSDLRMGTEPSYVFTFKVAEKSNPHARAIDPPERYGVQRDLKELGWAWRRLWNATLPPHP